MYAGLCVQKNTLYLPEGVILEGYFSSGGVESEFRSDDQADIIYDGSIYHLIAIDGVPAPWVPGQPPVFTDYNGGSLTSGQIPGAVYAGVVERNPASGPLDALEAATVEYRQFLASQGFNWEDRSRRYLYGGACVSHVSITGSKVSALALGDCVYAVRFRDGRIISSEDWVYPAQKVADSLLKNLHSDPKKAREIFNSIFKRFLRGHIANHPGGVYIEGWNHFAQELISAVDGESRKAEVQHLCDCWRESLQQGSYGFFDGVEVPSNLVQYREWSRDEVTEVLVCSDGAFDRKSGEIPNGIGHALFYLIDQGGVEAVRSATAKRARKDPDHTGPVGPESCLVYCKLH
jgi:hypothetical protein